MKKIAIVGGGAAGMLAALYAARAGARVCLLERNEKLGKKVYITGKGRCNATNACDRDEFFRNIPRNPRFLYAAFSKLDNLGMIDLLESLGCPMKVERGERAFPVSDKASDVTGALSRELRRLGVEVRFETRVRELIIEDGCAKGVVLESGQRISADAVIVATGGMSYPSTGSTGDGYKLAEAVGHTVIPARGGLVPVETEEKWCADLTGLSLKNVRLSANVKGGKRFYSDMGEMLFTHFGVSGPLVLSMSSLIPENGQVQLEIDLKPALDAATLDKRLLRDFAEMQNRQIATVMDGLAPHSLALMLLQLADISPYMPVHSVTSEQRKALVKLMKGVPLTVKGTRSMDEAIITRGGINVKEVNPSTMQSRLVSGLYFAGETLDIDAMTGGFNLQIAFSTGALAGESAAKEE